MNRLPVVLAALAIAGVLFLLVRIGQLEDRLKGVPVNAPRILSAQADAATPAAPAIEVAHYMNRIQNYAMKMWFAGQAGNLDLASFYRHEIKEEMETIANGNVTADGVPVSDYMKTFGIKAMDEFKEELKTNGLKDFNAHYGTLMNTCNSCHLSTGHPYIRVQVPTENRFNDQDFAPRK